MISEITYKEKDSVLHLNVYHIFIGVYVNGKVLPITGYGNNINPDIACSIAKQDAQNKYNEFIKLYNTYQQLTGENIDEV